LPQYYSNNKPQIANIKTMDFNSYQEKARETAIYPNMGNEFTYPALGLVGEAGEIANKLKKVIRDNGGVLTDAVRQAVRDEIGDCLWYIAQLATEMGADLGDIAQGNIDKLQSRKERGTLTGSGDNR
jgi:NTP pyrophosphatase (non-canonical NTP hydrolase)